MISYDRLYVDGDWLTSTGTESIDVVSSATEQIVAWDLIGARVAPDGMGGNVFEGGLYLYPMVSKDEVLRHFRRLHRRHHRKYPLDTASTFFRKHGVVFHRRSWRDRFHAERPGGQPA